jgi:RHH-type proline utilization regulon transcriptional repressor/proline dehydrogenase/delta 1-pyrroline-5-carboxylate dehydrogenase
MAMRMMGEQFVTGETIAEALANARELEAQGFRYSYDMLGEAALTAHDARALPRVLRRSHPRHRQGLGRARHLRGAGHLDQAVGAAPALQPRAARTRDGRAVPGAARSRCWRAGATTSA